MIAVPTFQEFSPMFSSEFILKQYLPFNGLYKNVLFALGCIGFDCLFFENGFLN